LVNSSDGIKKCDVGYVKSWGKGSTFREKMHIGTVGESNIGTSTLVPVNKEPALTCMNRTRRAR